MKKVFQTVVDPSKGNCMQAAIASLFDKELEEVPNFIEFGQKWFSTMCDFVRENGHDYDGTVFNKNYTIINTPTCECFKPLKWHRPSIMTKRRLHKEEGVNGLFYAGVYSPKFFSWQKQITHAVIIDKDYNIVHDPSPAYQDILGYPLNSLLGYNGILDITLFNPKK